MSKRNHAVQVEESNESNNETSQTVETTNEGQTMEATQEVVTVEIKKPDPNEMIKLLKTKSAVIRELSAKGLKANEIHKLLKGAGWHSDRNPSEPIRYQHVRNVLNQPLVGKREATKVDSVPTTV